MPRWGRPPGARKGRHNGGGGQWQEEMARVEEVETDEDEYGRQLVRNGRAAYMRQLEYGGRGPRRRQDYEDLTDEAESVDGGDYDLYDHEDSTVAYAVQLAMRDKEDQLVDKALERIRRAQMLGKKNVRLSQRELDALERRRQQTDDSRAARRPKQTRSAANVRPPSRRKSGGPPEQPPGPPPGPYPPFAFGVDPAWNRGAGATHGRPSSSSSANRPRTPTMQSLRPQQSNSPLRPGYPAFPERFPSNGRPQSMQPVNPRPLPDDPQWAPPYYNPLQVSPFAEQAPYQPQLPNDLRVGPQGRMSYPAGMPPIQAQHRQPVHPVGAPQQRNRQVPSSSDSESSEEDEESEESSEEEEDVQIVRVVERQGPPGPQRRNVSGGTRPRPRRSR